MEQILIWILVGILVITFIAFGVFAASDVKRSRRQKRESLERRRLGANYERWRQEILEDHEQRIKEIDPMWKN